MKENGMVLVFYLLLVDLNTMDSSLITLFKAMVEFILKTKLLFQPNGRKGRFKWNIDLFYII